MDMESGPVVTHRSSRNNNHVQLTGGGGVPVDTRSGWIDKVDSIVLGGGCSHNGPMWKSR